MRRVLSWIAIVLAAGAFVLLCLIWIIKVNALVPIGMFAAALILLAVVKRMPDEDGGKPGEGSNEPSGEDRGNGGKA